MSDPSLVDLSVIYRYSESLTDSIMSDANNNLRLLLPDYFGFTVTHYDPLRQHELTIVEEEEETAIQQSHDSYGDDEGSQPVFICYTHTCRVGFAVWR